MEKLSKLMVVMFLISLVLSCSSNMVEADASDCYDACTTGCVQPNTRLMRRCELKCGIRCNSAAASSSSAGCDVFPCNNV